MRALVLLASLFVGCGARTPIDLGGDGGPSRPDASGDDDDDDDDDDDVIGDDDDDVIGDDDDDVVNPGVCVVVRRLPIEEGLGAVFGTIAVATDGPTGAILYTAQSADGLQVVHGAVVENRSMSVTSLESFESGAAGDIDFSPSDAIYVGVYFGDDGQLRSAGLSPRGGSELGDSIDLGPATTDVSLVISDPLVALGFDSRFRNGAGLVQVRGDDAPAAVFLRGAGPSAAILGDTVAFASVAAGIGFVEMFDPLGQSLDSFLVGLDDETAFDRVALAPHAPFTVVALTGAAGMNARIGIDYGRMFYLEMPLPGFATSLAVAYDESRDRAGMIVNAAGDALFYFVDPSASAPDPLALGPTEGDVDIVATGIRSTYLASLVSRTDMTVRLEAVWIRCE